MKAKFPPPVTPEACGCRENERLVQELSIPAPGSQPLHFETRYPQSALSQFKLIFWKCAALPSCPLAANGDVKPSGSCNTTLDAPIKLVPQIAVSEYGKGAPWGHQR